MKRGCIKYAAALLALLALLLTACASTAGGTLERADSSVKAETLMETVYQVQSLFEIVPTVMLAASETDTLRVEPAETGVRVSARWSDAAWTVYFAVYGDNGQMLGAAAAPDSVTEWETEIECEAGQADTVKMFRLDRDLRPVAPAIAASTEAQKLEIALTVAGQVLTVEWAENSTVEALRELLKKGSITLDMSDYAGFEKGAPLPETLPQNNEPMDADAGDVILYQGKQFVIYYDKNSYSLTPLGRITGMTKEELQALLGTGNVTAVLSLSYTGAGKNEVLSGMPKVYFTSDISPEGLVRAFEALNWTPNGSTAVKLSTGEPPNSNYLRPELISDLVQSVNGTIVECNTAYGGSRASTALHKQVAEDHGFTAIADFDLMDEDGEVEIPVTGGVRLDRAIVGSHIDNYDSFLILSHFKGHAMAGLGGAIKNVAIGMSSPSGKTLVHTAGTSTTGSIFYSDQDAWLEALPEMVTAVRDYVGAENIVYVNVMNRLSVDCDCDGNPAEPDMHDIGILASYDPVALDQACVDLVYAAPDGASLIARMERQHGIHALEHGEEIGLGSRTYELVNLDG